MDQKTEAKIRKKNMKLYPIYQMFGLDFMFYYVIELLFFVQVKGLSTADVVLLQAFYAGFLIFMQFVVVIIASKITKKQSMILGNILDLMYILVIIFGTHFWIFVIAKLIVAIGVSIRNITEATFLNSTIPETKAHGDIFTKIDGKGYAKFSYLMAFTTAIAGFLFDVNPYIPMVLCVSCKLFAIIVASKFEDLEDEKQNKYNKEQATSKMTLEDIKDGFKFVLKSRRLKALLLIIAVIWGLLCMQYTYKTALLKDIGISVGVLGVIEAFIELVKGVYSTKANQFNKKYSNSLLTTIALSITFTLILSGMITLMNIDYKIQAIFITILCTIIYVFKGVYQVIKKRYLANFVKEDTLFKVYAANSIIDNVVKMIIAYIASVILNFMNIRYANLFIGIIFTIVVILISLYMKSRVGLKPEEYGENDVEIIK